MQCLAELLRSAARCRGCAQRSNAPVAVALHARPLAQRHAGVQPAFDVVGGRKFAPIENALGELQQEHACRPTHTGTVVAAKGGASSNVSVARAAPPFPGWIRQRMQKPRVQVQGQAASPRGYSRSLCALPLLAAAAPKATTQASAAHSAWRPRIALRCAPHILQDARIPCLGALSLGSAAQPEHLSALPHSACQLCLAGDCRLQATSLSCGLLGGVSPRLVGLLVLPVQTSTRREGNTFKYHPTKPLLSKVVQRISQRLFFPKHSTTCFV